MKRLIFLAAFTLACLTGSVAQSQTDSTLFTMPEGDTAMAARIIDNYIGLINFDHLLTDSILAVKTYVVDRSYPDDTITIYRWYSNGNKNRIEMWQKRRMEDAYFTDGKKKFRRFSGTRRVWMDLTQMSYYDLTMPLDIRGALYSWRAKGAEATCLGEYTYNERPVYRVFVASPELFDRNYFFEKETGLLFLLTEDEHLYGNSDPAANSKRVDWRAWHEFTPINGCLLPTIESYQIKGQVIIMHHYYHFEPNNNALFTQEFRKQ